MTQYLLSVYQPYDGSDEIPAPKVMERIMADVDQMNADLKAAGAWVFAAGLHAPTSATVVRAQDGDVVITDGPFIESKEHLGGFTIIEAADLDEALTWGRQLAQATTLPIEVRPFQDDRTAGA